MNTCVCFVLLAFHGESRLVEWCAAPVWASMAVVTLQASSCQSPWVSLAPWLLNSSLQPGECELLQLERPDLRDLPSLKRTVERERKVEGYGVFPSGNWVNVTGS